MTIVPHEQVPFWVIHLAAAFREHLENVLSELNLKVPEAIIIKALTTYGSLPLVAIAKHMSFAHPSALRHVDVLEEKGLIERQPHPNDRRIKLLVLTGEGKKIAPAVSKIMEKVIRPKSMGLTESEYDQLLKLLKQAYSKIGREFPHFTALADSSKGEAHKLTSRKGDIDK
ncbi:MarR family transcriptional regulator [bacterium]|nr:MarR family transcriptional regulator [bacterium]MBU1651318.1 MarR family transcriptional regulator [bacterium]MBU1881468.1 MarR family transcriptional regulator [bacterium]